MSFRETLALLNEAYEDDKLSRTQVYFWYKRFKDGRKSIADESRSGRPLTSTTDRNIGSQSAKPLVGALNPDTMGRRGTPSFWIFGSTLKRENINRYVTWWQLKTKKRLKNLQANEVKEKFIPLKRYNFFSEVQEKNQSFDDFVTKVKNKAVDCDFVDLTESLIKDRIVLGVLDKNITERYLQDPDLTLSKAIALGRAGESSRTQLKEIKEEVTVDKLSSYKETSSNKNTEHKFVKKNHKLFKACGKCASKHEYGNCPAYGVGLIKNKQSILIKEDAIPQVYTARRLPLAMREPVREELEKMSKLGAIKRINKPTEWSHPMTANMRLWLRKNEPWVWNDLRDRDYRDLKLQLTSAPCLRHFDPKLDIEISTDASSNGLQRLVLQLQHYDFDLKYIPGKKLYTADALSRDYIANDLFTTPEIEISQNNQVLMVTYSNNRHQDLVEATNNDPVLQEVKNYIENGWPIHKKTMNPLVKPFWDIKEELFEWEGLLCRGVKLVIPKKRRNHILSLLHKAHRGINSTLSLARSTLYWPGMCQEVEEFAKKCRICQKYSRNNTKEPLIPHETGNYPFQKIGVDLFEIEGRKYLGIIE
ncbi:K02A2.6-like [Cordylochernes scorpioides]|uniref:RNA-directed DNA polymerase n=1 Tax=Cordylochernes scorpioides TaxID=51811 RepID=A0ABY6LL91_9ARAC|nr:K02A2.6-like [Cordylochernes scorpioides]